MSYRDAESDRYPDLTTGHDFYSKGKISSNLDHLFQHFSTSPILLSINAS
jgi:hypothetical protein